MKSLLLLLLTLTLALHANNFSQAQVAFDSEEYEKALPLLLKSAQNKEYPEAAYKLGWMYQNGEGVPLDLEESVEWYKKAAEWEVLKTNEKNLYETIYKTMDPLSDDESTNTAVKFISGQFTLRAYEPNYLLVTYSDVTPGGVSKYAKINPHSGTNRVDYIQAELQYQISLRADYLTDWFGFAQVWGVAYTQTSYWQIFIDSAPFRETNYKPEVFVSLPFGHKGDAIGLKGMTFGYKHASNGQPVTSGDRTRPLGPMEGSRSRSWNRLYAKAFFQWNNFFTEFTVWNRISEKIENDDNPDIEEYYGNGTIKVAYIHKKLLLAGRVNPSFIKGIASVELSASYPMYRSEDVYFYVKGFSGYGNSLIDYDQKMNQIGVGISISR